MYYHAAAIIVAMVELVTRKAVVVVITVIIAAIVVVAVIVVLVLGVTRYCKYYECKLTSTLPNIKNNVRHLSTKQKATTSRCGNPESATLLEIHDAFISDTMKNANTLHEDSTNLFDSHRQTPAHRQTRSLAPNTKSKGIQPN